MSEINVSRHIEGGIIHEETFSTSFNDCSTFDWYGNRYSNGDAKIVIGPASFTLASHVPLFVAMFFSPGMAIAVALGTTFGFLSHYRRSLLCGHCRTLFCRDQGHFIYKNPSILLKNGKPTLFNARFKPLIL